MKSNKRKRRDMIRTIIERKKISNQMELQKELLRKGITVRQPTISRDLREMSIIKIPKGFGVPFRKAYTQVANDIDRHIVDEDRPDFTEKHIHKLGSIKTAALLSRINKYKKL